MGALTFAALVFRDLPVEKELALDFGDLFRVELEQADGHCDNVFPIPVDARTRRVVCCDWEEGEGGQRRRSHRG